MVQATNAVKRTVAIAQTADDKEQTALLSNAFGDLGVCNSEQPMRARLASFASLPSLRSELPAWPAAWPACLLPR